MVKPNHDSNGINIAAHGSQVGGGVVGEKHDAAKWKKSEKVGKIVQTRRGFE